MPESISVERLDPTATGSADLAEWCRLYVSLQAEQSGGAPPPGALERELRARDPDPKRSLWVGRVRGAIAAAGSLGLEADEYGYVRLYVAGVHRRKGVGRAALRRMAGEALAQKVTALRSTVVEGSPGERFAAAVGAEVLLRLVLEELHLDAHGEAKLATLARRPYPSYRLAHWRSNAPPDLVTSYSELKHFIHDAPGSSLQLGARRPWDVDRVRIMEEGVRRSGAELWVSAAVAPAAVVAFTEAAVHPGFASQMDTVVLPGHRGRGLALWLKADLALRLLRERPDVIRISSTVNEANVPMRTINRRLGYQTRWRRLLVEVGIHR